MKQLHGFTKIDPPKEVRLFGGSFFLFGAGIPRQAAIIYFLSNHLPM